MANLIEGSPARYHLATIPGVIQIAVNKSVMLTPTAFSRELTSAIQEELKLPEPFNPPSADKEWGFGPIIQQNEQPGSEWVIFNAGLPDVDIDQTRAFAVAATLGLVLSVLNQSDIESLAQSPQYSKVELSNSRGGFNSNPMYVGLFEPFVSWIKDKTEEEMTPPVLESMRSALAKLRPQSASFLQDRIRLRKSHTGLVNFYAPGDATALGSFERPEYESTGSTEGPISAGFKRTLKHGLSPKNLDHVYSQLVLLAGVAKLEELATGGYFKSSQTA